jgi:hypothetical protein
LLWLLFRLGQWNLRVEIDWIISVHYLLIVGVLFLDPGDLLYLLLLLVLQRGLSCIEDPTEQIDIAEVHLFFRKVHHNFAAILEGLVAAVRSAATRIGQLVTQNRTEDATLEFLQIMTLPASQRLYTVLVDGEIDPEDML